MRSIIGQCPECCQCPAPTLQWDSRSASKTKCGFPEFDGYVSSPPKIYSTETLSGSLVNTRCITCEEGSQNQNTGTTTTWDGACVYDKGSCSPVNDKKRHELDPVCFGSPSPYDVDLSCSTNPFPGSGFAQASINSTTITYTYTGDECDGFSGPEVSINGSASIVRSDEYTTAELKTNTLAALPAFDDDWDDTAGSYFNITSNDLTNSIREGKYRFRFKIPKVGRGTCYRIEWVERFTPETGDPVDTDKDFQWDGVTPEGYDPDDSATWPISDEFTIAIPETNGTTTVVDVVAFCRGCTA